MQEQQASCSQHSSACQRLRTIRCTEFVFKHNTTELSFAKAARTVVSDPDRVLHGVVLLYGTKLLGKEWWAPIGAFPLFLVNIFLCTGFTGVAYLGSGSN